MAEQNRKIGYVLRSNARDFVAGTRVLKEEIPRFGSLVRVPTNQNLDTYGIIYDISILDDGLVQQLVTTENVDAAVIADNRVNRIVPLEISVLIAGHRRGSAVIHRLPAKPPISLDEVWECTPKEITEFVANDLSYLEHIIQHAEELPIGELLAAHLQQVKAATGNAQWASGAAEYIINRLRNDHEALMPILNAMRDSFIGAIHD